MVRWKINKTDKERIKKLKNVTDILSNKNCIFQEFRETAKEIFDDWIKKLEDEKVFNWAGTFGFFGPISMGLVRRTFPSMFANKVVGVQAMPTPVRLAYALRVIYNENEESLSAKNNNV